MKVLGLVPARRGSKGIPDKNLRALAGKPLLEWTVDSARDSGLFDRLVLTTEDEDIAALGRALGLEVPFMRPAEIASDTAAMVDVVLHAVGTLAAAGYRPDVVALLQPTSPLRTAGHLAGAVQLLEGWDAVCSVVPLPQELCPHYVMRIGETGGLEHFLPDGARYTRRQDVPVAYRRDGSVYVVRTDALVTSGSLYGRRCAPLVLRPDETLTIDGPLDWAEAEQRLAERLASS